MSYDKQPRGYAAKKSQELLEKERRVKKIILKEV